MVTMGEGDEIAQTNGRTMLERRLMLEESTFLIPVTWMCNIAKERER